MSLPSVSLPHFYFLLLSFLTHIPYLTFLFLISYPSVPPETFLFLGLITSSLCFTFPLLPLPLPSLLFPLLLPSSLLFFASFKPVHCANGFFESRILHDEVGHPCHRSLCGVCAPCSGEQRAHNDANVYSSEDPFRRCGAIKRRELGWEMLARLSHGHPHKTLLGPPPRIYRSI